MAIPKITEEHIHKALDYIDQHGVPANNQSTTYDLITNDGKKYPPKYVIAVANHLATGEEIVTDGFNSVEARTYLVDRGFSVAARQEEFELLITQDQILSTDPRFDINDLGLGDNYKQIEAYFKKGDGTIVFRKYEKNERRHTNQTLPRIAFQLYEDHIAALTAEEKADFPICRYSPNGLMISGIFDSVEAFNKYRNTIEFMRYRCGDGSEFVIYCWNIFSTLYFLQECLKRFGAEGDSFVLLYREKDGEEDDENPSEEENCEDIGSVGEYRHSNTPVVLESKNIIFRGAPGTGKSYIAKQIAADIVTDGQTIDPKELTAEQASRIAFVQFHPSYDYSDFVEGLRPYENGGILGFKLQDGTFKAFVDRARRNFEDSQKSKETIEKETSVQALVDNFLSNVEFGETFFKTKTGNEFTITGCDDKSIDISIPGNATVKALSISRKHLCRLLESGNKIENVKDVRVTLGASFVAQSHSYLFVLYNAVASMKKLVKTSGIKKAEKKNFVFIIDEINRGEISKIFGELFYSIEPDKRGPDGKILTQYANLHDDPSEEFYIPENVYIIGTMNDIDRSVDTFDFAMRRRFRFVEIDAEKHVDMLDVLGEAKKQEAVKRMRQLNMQIEQVDGLGKNYQIGAAYFLKLRTVAFEALWSDYLEPLLQEYINGMPMEKELMKKFRNAYDLKGETGESEDEDA